MSEPVLTVVTLGGDGTAAEAAGAPPDRVRRWLEGIHVEDSDLTEYDRLIDDLGPSTDEEEDTHDQE